MMKVPSRWAMLKEAGTEMKTLNLEFGTRNLHENLGEKNVRNN